MPGGGDSTGPARRGTSRDIEAQSLLPGCGQDGETNKERQEHMRHLQKEAFQLANYYFVFQGVIFTAFYSMPAHVKCQYRWVPFTLSLLAGVLNLCALVTIICNYKTTLDDMDKDATRGASNCQATSPSENGTDDNRGGTVTERGNHDDSISVKCSRCWRFVYVMGALSLFIGFFAVTLVGCLEITCGDKSGNAATPPPPPRSL